VPTITDKQREITALDVSGPEPGTGAGFCVGGILDEETTCDPYQITLGLGVEVVVPEAGHFKVAFYLIVGWRTRADLAEVFNGFRLIEWV
jgi:hypothetical protein